MGKSRLSILRSEIYPIGKGPNLGDFKARAQGIGPVLSYTSKVGGQDVITELKWLHEFDNKNRVQGDTVSLKVLTKF